jgi:hypothetical protein
MRDSIALRGFIAQALLAERLAQRERDAKIADEWNDTIGAPGGDASFRGTAVVARLVAAAIRQS